MAKELKDKNKEEIVTIIGNRLIDKGVRTEAQIKSNWKDKIKKVQKG